jgi:hypothetical protein
MIIVKSNLRLAIMLMAISFAQVASGGPPKGSATFRDKVTAVGADFITILVGKNAGYKVEDIASDGAVTAEGPSNVKKLKVGIFSTVLVDGLPGSITDVKPGMGVEFRQGMNPDEADYINAHTVPPAVKEAKTAPPDKRGRVKGVTKSLFRKITGDVVLNISPTRITVGQVGGVAARAFYIKPFTSVTLDGAATTASAIQPGMSVEVHGDSTTAESVDLKSAAPKYP